MMKRYGERMHDLSTRIDCEQINTVRTAVLYRTVPSFEPCTCTVRVMMGYELDGIEMHIVR